MIQGKHTNEMKFEKNKIISCDTNGIYVQGIKSRPLIISNEFKFCRGAALAINHHVSASIIRNVFV